MNVLTIAMKSVRQRMLASSLTSISVALGVMLMVAVLVIHGIIDRMFNQQSIGYDLIVGPKGSDLQLVLSSVYRITPATQTLPYKYYLQLKNDKKVGVAIPIALGDNTDKGNFPIVGTIFDYFTNEYAPNKKFHAKWKDGKQGFRTTLGAIIGSEVARKNNWTIGSTFKLIHSGDTSHVHKEEFTVVGILDPTGTPNDKTAFIHLDGFYGIADHGKPFDEAVARLEEVFNKKYTDEEKEALRRDPTTTKEVSAIFIKGRQRTRKRKPEDDSDEANKKADDEKKESSMFNSYKLMQEINAGNSALAVNPVDPMKRLMDNIVGNIRSVIMVLIGLIIIVSGISIFVSIYNSMSDRKKEIAIMRALGAQRSTVFSIILLESILLCLAGGVLGVLLGHGLVFAAAPIVAAKSGLLINPFAFEKTELFLIPVLIVMASLVGFIPGMTAYRTDVAEALSD